MVLEAWGLERAMWKGRGKEKSRTRRQSFSLQWVKAGYLMRAELGLQLSHGSLPFIFLVEYSLSEKKDATSQLS